MLDMYGESDDSAEIQPATDQTDANGPPETGAAPADKALVQKLLSRIRADKRFFAQSFKRMARSQFMAMHGRDMDYSAKNYKANIVGRHINQKTAALYAKNPKIVARRAERLDFTVWDETTESLQASMQVLATAQQMVAGAQMGAGLPPVDPMQAGAALQNAQAIMADVQQGMMRRQMLKKFGRTLEIVFARSMRQQTPLDFKTAMKQMVRRTLTNAAGYVELGFQREYGVPSAVSDAMDDYQQRMNHLQKLVEKAAEGEIDEYSAEMAELAAQIEALQAEPQKMMRAGLTFDFHESTKVIPDRFTRNLIGFIGAKHLTIELPVMTKEDCEEKFGVDLGDEYTPYNLKGEREGALRGVDLGDDDFAGVFAVDRKKDDMVCVFKHFDKRTGLVSYLCDGHSGFLKPPAAPDVCVPRFWPVYPLTFNAVENETELFPPSDVELLADQQNELNRSRQGKREHREAARPRWVYTNGTFDPEKDIPAIERAKPFEAIGITGDPQSKIADRLQPFPVPGVDPNLYDTNEVMQDGTLTVGAQAAQLGGLTKSTATQAAIADSAMTTSDASAVDDLDAFLTMMARDGGQILMAELTKDEVVQIAGPGAVWVEDLEMTEEDIYNEIALEVEAGSSGKPNQTQEIRNIKDIGPIIMQTPGISPEWFAREIIRRFDDRVDLTEAVVAGLPAMVAQNRMLQPMQGGQDPAESDPNQQGDKGGDKGPPPSDPTGSGPAYGSNQV